jgi:hypothetical protein
VAAGIESDYRHGCRLPMTERWPIVASTLGLADLLGEPSAVVHVAGRE